MPVHYRALPLRDIFKNIKIKQGTQIHKISLPKTINPRWLKKPLTLSGDTSIGVHGKKYR